MKSKRSEVATINIVQAQVEEMYFIFNLECRHAALLRGIPHGLPTKSQYSTKPKNQVRWVKLNGHTHTPDLTEAGKTGGSALGSNG
jgi:hypothetical protein